MIIGIKYRLAQAVIRSSYALGGVRNYLRLFDRNEIRQNSGPPPTIGAVIVGRNDDYMPDFAERIHATIAWNVRHLVAEPILVEWNPPRDRELLATKLVRAFPTLKVYVVPEVIHNSVCQNPRLPLMEYHAKNVGIRRATSDWIIAMNADVAIAPDTIKACRSLPLNGEVALTAERIDIHWREWRREPVGIRDCVRYKRIIPHVEHGTGDFLMAGREVWHRARGYDENLLRHRIGCDARGAEQLHLHGADLRRIGRILHLAHPTSCTEGIMPHHGEAATMDDLPYQNGEGWGCGNYREVEIGERIWRLE